MGHNQRSEWQLVAFTILTQMAVGTFVIWGLAVLLISRPNPFSEGLFATAILAITLAALILGSVAAAAHLGRPWGAVFSLTNLRTSWLSREALMGLSFGLLVTVSLVRLWGNTDFDSLDGLVAILGMVCGLGLVYSIARLYMLRTVPAWHNPGTPISFYITSFLLGLVTISSVWLAAVFGQDAAAIKHLLNFQLNTSHVLIFGLLCSQLGIFVLVALYLHNQGGAAAQSARLLWRKLRGLVVWRWLTALSGLVILVLQSVLWLSPVSLFACYALVLISEILGRSLFYGFYQRTGV